MIDAIEEDTMAAEPRPQTRARIDRTGNGEFR